MVVINGKVQPEDSKYWIVDTEDGYLGIEDDFYLTYEQAWDYISHSYGGEIYDLYPVSKFELYASEVDIW